MRLVLKICGVCMAHSPVRSTLSFTIWSMEARFTVSGMGEAQQAAPCSRAVFRQARMSRGVVSGRAPSWMAMNSEASVFSACRPFHTDMWRSTPPLTTFVTLANFPDFTSPSTSSMRSSFVTTAISSTSRVSWKALMECHSTGCPASGAKSLSNPMRRLLPAATMMALTIFEDETQCSAAATAALSALPSARPADFSTASFITAPICALEVAPASAMDAATSCVSSSGESVCGR